MWYRIITAQTQQVQPQQSQFHSQLTEETDQLGIVPEKFYPELQELLEEIGLTAEHYGDLPEHAKKSVWDIIVHKLDRNTYNSFNDSDTPGFDAEQARRHSPYHKNPSETTLEEKLEATRHDTVDNVPNNMQQAEKGKGGEFLLNGNGFPQRAKGYGNPAIFMDNLSSIQTMV
jgi:hypothetical protein